MKPNIMIEEILKKFVDELLKRSDSQVETIIWFGSTVRGEATEDSDIDVLVIAKHEDVKLRDIAFDVAADISLEYDCLINALLISKERFESMKDRRRLLARNMEKDGVYLWQRAA